MRRILLVALLMFLTTVAACGEDSAPSRAEFARNADGVCADIEQQIQSLGSGSPDSPEEFSRLIAELKQQINEGVERLSELDRPEGDAGETADRFIRTLESELRNQAIPALDEFDAALKAGDRRGVRAAEKKLDALDQTPSDQLARDLGAEKCAEA